MKRGRVGTIHRTVALASAFFILGICVLSFFSIRVCASPTKSNSGFQIDLFCQNGGKGINASCLEPFYVGDRIMLFANVTYNQEPVQSILVAFQVNNPSGAVLLTAIEVTNASGIASTEFTITKDVYIIFPSVWASFSTTSPAQKTVIDFMSFEVLPVPTVGGISESAANSAGYMLTRVAIVEILIASLLIVFARFRKEVK